MHFIDKPSGCFCDRKELEPALEPIDVIMMTLDAEHFLEKSLYSVYREIPVNRLIVCDGGSKAKTTEILKNFPRVELHIRPDIKSGGKSLEFLFSQTKTEWFVLVDADIELSRGWYDEMHNHKSEYDVLENSKVVLAYHKYVEYPKKLEQHTRAETQCHLLRKSAIQNFHCDDDYMWRHTDFLLRQVVEKSGHKYGKVSTTTHVHNETERIPYGSATDKSYQKIIIEEPKYIIIDKKKSKLKNIQISKGVIKYLDPNFPLVKNYLGFDFIIRDLDRKWIEKNGPKWLPRYDKAKSLSFSIKYFLYRHIVSKNKKLKSIAAKFSH